MRRFLISVMLFVGSLTYGQTDGSECDTIELTKNSSGIYEVPIIINKSLKIQFVLDTGASESSIPFYVFYTLLKNGTITIDDKLTEQTFMMADGSTSTNSRCLIREITIGGFILTNVSVSISDNLSSPLLLGQNVLAQFATITINYRDNTLLLKE